MFCIPRSVVAWTLTAFLLGAQAAPACTGDCNSDGRVGVDEIVVGVGIALGETAWARCVRMDADRDGSVDVDDLLRGVQRALDGCVDCTDAGTCPDDFDFDAQREISLDLSLQLDGAPVAAAVVSLDSPRGTRADGLDTSADEIFRGATDPDGRLVASIRVPAWVDSVDLVVQKSGLRGPYTDETVRLAAGPFAPTARLRVPVEALSGLELELERKNP